MIATPRTDVQKRFHYADHHSHECVTAQFAGELERETHTLFEALRGLVEAVSADALLPESLWIMKHARAALGGAILGYTIPAGEGVGGKWTHPCDAVQNTVTLWVDKCPHCGRPAA